MNILKSLFLIFLFLYSLTIYADIDDYLSGEVGVIAPYSSDEEVPISDPVYLFSYGVVILPNIQVNVLGPLAIEVGLPIRYGYFDFKKEYDVGHATVESKWTSFGLNAMARLYFFKEKKYTLTAAAGYTVSYDHFSFDHPFEEEDKSESVTSRGMVYDIGVGVKPYPDDPSKFLFFKISYNQYKTDAIDYLNGVEVDSSGISLCASFVKLLDL